MNDETATAEAWAADGDNLTRDGEIVGSLSTPELAAWVAEACEVFAEMEAAQAVWAASDEAPNCAMVDIGGEQLRVQGGAAMPEPLREAMSDVVSTVRRNMAEAKDAERAEIERLTSELEAAEDLTSRLRKDHRAELAEAEKQIRAADVTIAELRERDHRMTEMAAGYVNAVAEDLRAQEGWARQLYSAWWSARIGRAMARDQLTGLRLGYDGLRDIAQNLADERDQLKAANGRARTLATNATRTECGAGWTLNPNEVRAALDEPALKEA
jgi:hypothetical protein